MAYHVALVEIDNRDPRNVLQRLQRFDHAGAFVGGQVNLRHVASDDAFGMRTDAREQHEHLLGGCVLGFIENHERVVQGAAAHVSERRNFNRLPRNRPLDLFRLEHIAQCVIKRAQIRCDLLLELARQKSKCFARFHRGSG